MLKINTAIVCAALVVPLAFPINISAVTIEEIAAKNNKIIELDQEIVIAEKSKKLEEIKNSVIRPEMARQETIALPRHTATQRPENKVVISVHGTPASPVVDMQYGDNVVHAKLGDVMPDGWQITAVSKDSVTFRKKVSHKPDLVKNVGIGHDSKAAPDADGHFGALAPRTVPVPDRAIVPVYPVGAN